MNIYTDKRTGIKYADYVLNGKRIRKSLKTKNKAVALLKAAKLADDKTSQSTPSITYPVFKEKYLSFIQANKAPGTVSIIENAIQKLEDFKLPEKLSDITPSLLDDLKTKLKNNYSRPYVAGINRVIRALKTMMRQAEAWSMVLPQNWNNVKKFKEPKGRVEFHTVQEIEELINFCPNDHWRLVVLLGAQAGLRRGEMAALRWADVDFKNNQLYIAPNKTEKHRFVPIAQDLREALLNAQKQAKNDFVVQVGQEGSRKSKDYISAAYLKMTADFQVNNKKVHCFLHKLRHTFASHLVQAGVDLYRVSKLLGHSSITMTEIYSHLAPIDLQSAISYIPNIEYKKRKKNADSK